VGNSPDLGAVNTTM